MTTASTPVYAGRSGQSDDGSPTEAEMTRQDVAHLRNWKLMAVEANVCQSMIGLLAAATLTLVYFHGTYGTVVLAWYGLMLAVCLTRFALAKRLLSGKTELTTSTRFGLYLLFNGLLPAIVTSFPGLVVLNESGFDFAFMLALLLGTFWSGGFLYAPIVPVSMTFMGVQFLTFAALTVFTGMTLESAGLLTLFAVGAGSGYTLIRQHSETLQRSIVQRMDIEKQADLIRLLLNEHESQSSDWLWQTDAQARITAPSTRFAEAVGMSAAALSGRRLRDVLAGQGGITGLDGLFSAMDQRLAFRDLVVASGSHDTPRWYSVSGHPIHDSQQQFCGYRGVMSDVTTAKQAEHQITYLAHHDGLTGLANRAHFCQTLDHDLAAGSDLALLSIDLDGFKPINDCHGHPVGDAFLIEIAARIAGVAGRDGLVARFGGDEFLVRTWQSGGEAIEDLCWRLLAELRRPAVIDGIDLSVGASIGVAIAPRDGDSQIDLLKAADAALYEAKHSGRGTFMTFVPEMADRLQGRSALIRDLHGAVERGEMSLVFQPVVSACTSAVTGCEALVRWTHPERGMVSPGEFIPLAEESGAIVPIGSWVIAEACRIAATWPSDKYVALNISPAQFQGEDLPARVAEALHMSGLPASRLWIEVTESFLVEDESVALAALNRIRDLGVTIALDDFGTGFSSLAYLRLFPFSKIKIDRAFVNDLTGSPESQVIVRAVRDIARGFDMTITAEGIETKAQVDLLRHIGCDEFQGFLFAKPMAPTALQDLVSWADAA